MVPLVIPDTDCTGPTAGHDAYAPRRYWLPGHPGSWVLFVMAPEGTW